MNECMLTGHVPTKQNPANLCTKVIIGGAQQDYRRYLADDAYIIRYNNVNKAPIMILQVPPIPLLLSCATTRVCGLQYIFLKTVSLS